MNFTEQNNFSQRTPVNLIQKVIEENFKVKL
jgi:hypothetical protein